MIPKSGYRFSEKIMLKLKNLRRLHDLFASRRQCGERRSGPRSGRLFRRLRMQHAGGEPVIERMAATVAGRHWLLRLALRAVGRAVEPNVEVLGMPPPRPHLGQPF